jgi:large subunit ribosomal protein L19
MNILEMYEKEHMKRDIPETPIGSTVKVHYRIIEGDKERIQIFEGVVIARKRAALRSSITVRKVSAGIGIERVFPPALPQGGQDRGHQARPRSPQQALLPEGSEG